MSIANVGLHAQLLAEAGDAGEGAMLGAFAQDVTVAAASRPILPIPGQRNILVSALQVMLL